MRAARSGCVLFGAFTVLAVSERSLSEFIFLIIGFRLISILKRQMYGGIVRQGLGGGGERVKPIVGRSSERRHAADGGRRTADGGGGGGGLERSSEPRMTKPRERRRHGSE